LSTLQHPHAELSAYVDRALPAAEQAVVEAHVDACASCRARIAELRATATLIRSLPSPEPSRSLVPRLAPPFWLAPVRTVASLASGAFVLLFVGSVILVNAPSGAPTAALERAAQPAAAPDAKGFAATPSQVPAPAAAQRGAASSDAAKRLDVASPTASPAADVSARATSANDARPLVPAPWIWLMLAAVSAAIAILLQRRLRSPA